MVTMEDIEKAVTARDIGELLPVITSSVFVPVLGRSVRLDIYSDPSCETINTAQT